MSKTRTHSGTIRIVRGVDDQILLLVNAAEVGHPAPMVIEITAHEWSQILANPTLAQTCFVHLGGVDLTPPPKKAG